MQNKREIEPDIDKITGFAGAKFNKCGDESNKQKIDDNPLRTLISVRNAEKGIRNEIICCNRAV